MMTVVFVATLVVFILSIAGLAVGVMAGGRPIAGSCGGVACVKTVRCEGCPHASDGTP